MCPGCPREVLGPLQEALLQRIPTHGPRGTVMQELLDGKALEGLCECPGCDEHLASCSSQTLILAR